MSDMSLPGEGVMMAMAPCISCGLVFMFDPDWVPSIYYLWRLNTSLDLALEAVAEAHADGAHDDALTATGCGVCQPTADRWRSEAVREPICPACCRAANPERAQRGFDLLPEGDSLGNRGERT